MAVCTQCSQEMTDHVGCVLTLVQHRDGIRSRPPIWWDGGASFGTPGRDCHDCGCPPFTYHHPGCDMERCPFCGGQLISCGCIRSDDDEEFRREVERDENWIRADDEEGP